jgi:hypothetical protein
MIGVDDANTLMETFRRAVADTCKASAIFNSHLTGSTEEYSAAEKMLQEYLAVEHSAYIAIQDALVDCEFREREFGRAECICTAKLEAHLDAESENV